MKVKIENITEKILKSMENNQDLYALRMRFLQLWDKYFQNTSIHSVTQRPGVINKVDFLHNYSLLMSEFKDRGLGFNTHSVDKYLMRKNFLRGISPSEIGEIVVAHDCIVIHGDVLKNPKTAATMDISVRKDVKDFLETKDNEESSLISKFITNQIDGGIEIRITDNKPSGEKYVPLFDLVLRPHSSYETKVWKDGEEVSNADFTYDIDNTIVATIESKELRKDNNKFAYTCKLGSIDIGPTELIDDSLVVGTKVKLELNKNEFSENGELNLKLHKILEATQDDETTGEAYKKLLKVLETTQLKKFADFKINKLNTPEHVAGGIVYEPDVVDLQGDFTDQAEIQKAMYYFMEQQHQMKIMHGGIPRDDIVVLENFQAEIDTMKGGQLLRKGAWYLTVKVNDEGIWQDIESGEITGFSLGGYSQAEILE